MKAFCFVGLLVHHLAAKHCNFPQDEAAAELPSGWVPPPPHGPVCKDCPNIVFSLTDDQDVELGGWTPMKQTQALLQEDKHGALLTSWRIHTPICSPSRSQTVSGRYFHNIKSSVAVPPPKLLPAATAHVDASKYANA